eukprot:5895369-Alexandrium_andersonii.AAC.1
MLRADLVGGLLPMLRADLGTNADRRAGATKVEVASPGKDRSGGLQEAAAQEEGAGEGKPETSQASQCSEFAALLEKHKDADLGVSCLKHLVPLQ